MNTWNALSYFVKLRADNNWIYFTCIAEQKQRTFLHFILPKALKRHLSCRIILFLVSGFYMVKLKKCATVILLGNRLR